MVRIFMKFNSATYKNNFTKNDNFIVENVKVIKIVIAVCTCIIGAIWLLFAVFSLIFAYRNIRKIEGDSRDGKK